MKHTILDSDLEKLQAAIDTLETHRERLKEDKSYSYEVALRELHYLKCALYLQQKQEQKDKPK